MEGKESSGGANPFIALRGLYRKVILRRADQRIITEPNLHGEVIDGSLQIKNKIENTQPDRKPMETRTGEVK